MTEYIVDWSENVVADTPEKAAQKAMDIQISKSNPTFIVTERVGKNFPGRCWWVDIDPTPEKRLPTREMPSESWAKTLMQMLLLALWRKMKLGRPSIYYGMNTTENILSERE